MKEIIIKKLTLEYFKGIHNLEVLFNDKDTNIYGDNAVGKTTIFDAFTWLLFDKDSLNRSDFGIKTIGKDKKVMHGVEHKAECQLEVDGEEITLKKVFKEKWTKKRGSADKTFEGHTTSYFINEVPYTKTKYQKAIDNIISEDDFKLITNPLFFNETLKKQDRRDYLMAFSNLSDDDVLKKMDDADYLKEALKKYSLEELKAMAKAQMKELNNNLKEIPIRIDELNSQIKEYDFKMLKVRATSIKANLKKMANLVITPADFKEAYQVKLREIEELRAKVREIKEKHDKDYKARNNAAKEAYNNRLEVYKDKVREKVRIENEIGRIEYDIENKKHEQAEKRSEWNRLNAKVFSGSTKCELCGQERPADDIEKLKAEFNLHKSKKLEEIAARGKALGEEIAELETKRDAYKEKLTEYEDLQMQTEVDVEWTDIEWEDYPEEYYDLQKEIDEKTELLEIDSNPPEDDQEEKRIKLEKELEEITQKLACKGLNEDIQAKIEDYKTKEREIAKLYEESQAHMYEIEEFIKTKVALISDDINAMFKYVNFKLFDKQINGGIVETCEAMINGVPYSYANNAAKINAGLDVINTITEKIGVRAPIFVDNAESVNEIIDTNSQLIELVVSTDKELRIA